MHEENARELIDGMLQIGGSLLKDHLRHQKEMEKLELQREMRVREAEILHGQRQRENGSSVSEATRGLPEGMSIHQTAEASPEPTPEQLRQEIRMRKNRTVCGTCISILRGLEEMQAGDMRKGLEEYDELKAKLDQGLEGDELRRFVKQFDVLPRALAVA